MFPIRTILHPTDFSERSGYALEMACSLARDHGARLILLHVSLPPVVIYGDVITDVAGHHNLAKSKVELQNMEVPMDLLRVERRVVAGSPAEEIVKAAEEENADFIVLGSHGRRGFSRALLGSVAEVVMRRATCPVLVVKSPFPGAPAAEPVEETAGVV